MIPDNHANIITNMPEEESEAVLDALVNKRDEIDFGNGSLFVGSGQQEFVWQGINYEFFEYYEEVTNLYRRS